MATVANIRTVNKNRIKMSPMAGSRLISEVTRLLIDGIELIVLRVLRIRRARITDMFESPINIVNQLIRTTTKSS